MRVCPTCKGNKYVSTLDLDIIWPIYTFGDGTIGRPSLAGDIIRCPHCKVHNPLPGQRLYVPPFA